MIVNGVKEDVITIENIVNKWGIPEELKQSKIEILESWKKKINDDEVFEILLRICNNFQYYSEKLTADTYKLFFEDARDKCVNFDTILKSTLFTPLRSRDRIESSIDMFSQFRLANKIDANSTFVEGPIMFIKRFRESKENLEKKIKDVEKERKEIENKINILNSDLSRMGNPKAIKKIREKIKSSKNQLKNFQEIILKNVNEFNRKYYYIKNIIIIDDFVGTGSSGEKFIKKLAKELNGTNIDITFYLWILETSITGKERIESKAEDFGIKLNIKYGRVSKDVLAENELFSTDELQIVKREINSILLNYNIPRSRYSNNHALASFVNAPNNNLALLSNESNQWEALFLRLKRVAMERKVQDEKELKDILKFVMGR